MRVRHSRYICDYGAGRAWEMKRIEVLGSRPVLDTREREVAFLVVAATDAGRQIPSAHSAILHSGRMQTSHLTTHINRKRAWPTSWITALLHLQESRVHTLSVRSRAGALSQSPRLTCWNATVLNQPSAIAKPRSCSGDPLQNDSGGT